MRTRRELLKLSPVLALGAFAVPAWREPLIEGGLSLSDRAAGGGFRTGHLAPTYPDSALTAFEQFPYNFFDVRDPEIDLARWRLTVGGAVSRPGDYSIEDIRALPRVRQNTRHVCVEGWDVIGRFGGASLSDFLELVGADPSALYLTTTSADGYYESLDIESARHPQSLLCYEMYDRPLDRGHGAPLRLLLPTKLGYKSAKYLTSLSVTHVLAERRAFWADLGYSWHGGL